MRIGGNRFVKVSERSEVLTGTCVNNEGLSVWVLVDIARNLLNI
jgi:hypothetical protein